MNLTLLLGSIQTLDTLDYEIRADYELTIRATDTKTGAYADTVVNIQLEVNYQIQFKFHYMIIQHTFVKCCKCKSLV